MAKAQQIEPEFKVTLSDQQLQALGQCCAIWSQIDHLLGLAISACTGVPVDMTETFLDDALTGRRLGIFERVSAHLTDAHLRHKAQSICGRLGPLMERRNRITHGIWGRYRPDEKTQHVATYYARDPENPVLAQELPNIAKKFAHESRELADLVRALRPGLLPPATSKRIIVFGPGKKEI